MFTGGAVGRAGRAVVRRGHERESLVHGRQQVLVVLERFGHVLGAVEDAQVQADQSEGDPGGRQAVRPVRGHADGRGDQRPDGAAVRLGVHVVHRPGRAPDQRRVRREYRQLDSIRHFRGWEHDCARFTFPATRRCVLGAHHGCVHLISCNVVESSESRQK